MVTVSQKGPAMHVMQEDLEVDAVTEDGTPVTTVDPETWFLATGDRNGIMEYYVYDRTNIRLSQLSLSYTLEPER